MKPEGHVTAGRSPAHERLNSQALAKTLTTLDHIRDLRRALERYNDSALGAAVNAAENEVCAIKHRLLRGMDANT